MKNEEESLAFASIEELSALLTKRKISPVELTEMFLSRIERHNPSVNAFITITAEHALETARRAEKQILRRGGSRRKNSPLLGIPITIKDNIWTRGIRSTAGSKILRDFVPPEDSTVARKLARAGAILIGETHRNDPERVCLRDYSWQRTLRPCAQSVGARSDFRRIERGLRRRDCRGPVRG